MVVGTDEVDMRMKCIAKRIKAPVMTGKRLRNDRCYNCHVHKLAEKYADILTVIHGHLHKDEHETAKRILIGHFKKNKDDANQKD